jgi:hypothetical protein
MALPSEGDVAPQDSPSVARSLDAASNDPRALRILAKTIYRELRQNGLAEQDVIAIAGELLSLVAGEVKDRRRSAENQGTTPSPRSGSR